MGFAVVLIFGLIMVGLAFEFDRNSRALARKHAEMASKGRVCPGPDCPCQKGR